MILSWSFLSKPTEFSKCCRIESYPHRANCIVYIQYFPSGACFYHAKIKKGKLRKSVVEQV